MESYTEIVKGLRDKFLAYDVTGNHKSAQFYKDAADAFEALQAEVKRLKDSNDELREKQTYIDRYGAEWLTSAKDVPNYAYEHGYADGTAEAKVQLSKRGEWVINEGRFGWHCSCCKVDNHYAYKWNNETAQSELQGKYCPNCGARMGDIE